MEDVLVIGGGIVGTCTAYELAARGAAVTLVERLGEICPMDASSYANAGLIIPSDIYPLASPGALGQGLRWLLDSGSPFYIEPRLDPVLFDWLLRFRAASREGPMRAAMPLLRELHVKSADRYAELSREHGNPWGFERRGWLNVFASPDGFAGARAGAQESAALGVKAEVVEADAVRERVPQIGSGAAGAIYTEEDGHVVPHRFVRELARLAAEKGATLAAETDVIDLQVQGRRVTGVVTTRGVHTPDTVVVAAGAWTPRVARPLGLRLPIQPAKGYSVTIPRPEGFPELPLYLTEAHVCVTPMGEWLRFAGTLELAGLDFAVRWKRVRRIRESAARFLPGTDKVTPLEIWRGLRPLTPDGLPIIGRSPSHDNVVIASGHCMLGNSLGPVTGKLVAQLAAGEAPEVDLYQLRPERFAGLPGRAA